MDIFLIEGTILIETFYLYCIFSADPYLYIFLGGLLEIPSYIVLWPMISKLGRMRSLSLLYLVCGLSIFAVTILITIEDGKCDLCDQQKL